MQNLWNNNGIVNFTYNGTDLARSDQADGIVVKVVGGTAQYNNSVTPRVEKLASGSQAGQQHMAGVIQTVEEAGSTRFPSGVRSGTYKTSGVLKTKKTTGAPALTDIGGIIQPDDTVGSDAGGVKVDTAATATGRGLVVGITGTDATDHLLVDWDFCKP